MTTNPYTRLKDETDAKITALTEQNAAFRKENKALEESWNKVLADLSTARQRISTLEHALSYANILATKATEAANYLARSWFTGSKGRKVELDLHDAADLYRYAYEPTKPKGGLGLFGSQNIHQAATQLAAAKKKD